MQSGFFEFEIQAPSVTLRRDGSRGYDLVALTTKNTEKKKERKKKIEPKTTKQKPYERVIIYSKKALFPRTCGIFNIRELIANKIPINTKRTIRLSTFTPSFAKLFKVLVVCFNSKE